MMGETARWAVSPVRTPHRTVPLLALLGRETGELVQASSMNALIDAVLLLRGIELFGCQLVPQLLVAAAVGLGIEEPLGLFP
jgi:hypothetical protein